MPTLETGAPGAELFQQAAMAQFAGRFAEAEAAYRRILDSGAGDVRTVCLLAVAMAQQRKFEAAEQLLAGAGQFGEPTVDYFRVRGNVLIGLGRLAEALACFLRGLGLAPREASLYCDVATVLIRLKRHDEALAWADRALALSPALAIAHCCRSAALNYLGHHEDALAAADCASALAPRLHLANFVRGLALEDLNREGEALACYETVIKGNPEFAEAHHNAAHLYLARGDYANGWSEYEWRWKIAAPSSTVRRFPQPLWLGAEDLTGKTVLLHSEQGLGDTLQYCRFASAVADRGARVILQVQRPLAALMAALPGPAKVVADDEPLPEFDFHCPLATLPLALDVRLDTMPAATAYLAAPPAHLAKWRLRLSDLKRPFVCVAWAGNLRFAGDPRRSVLLPRLLPLVNETPATFLSVQKDLRDGDRGILANTEQIIHLGDGIGTFEDTAAILSLADVVISSDTSIVHLAGALARPVWVLLPTPADWRWLRGRDTSPWYPTARLFRQEQPGDWTGVVDRVARELRLVTTSTDARCGLG